MRGWLREEVKLREFVQEVDHDEGLTRKRVKTAQDPAFDKAMFSWFVGQRVDGAPISGPLIQAKAVELHEALRDDTAQPSSFKCSTGWLSRWKQRHGVRHVRISGEIRSSDVEAAEAFIPKLQEMVEESDLSPEQVYNADETGLYYKMLPDRTLATSDDTTSSHGFKQRKDRVTLLLGTNWAGTHKLKPLCIGKFARPRCLQHVNMSELPVLYTHSKKAWMTASLFEDWFHNDFVPAVRKHLRRQGVEPKAILLLDNCTAHPPQDTLTSRDGKIRVVFLPKNTTAQIQPMDQGLIATLKQNYRKEMMRRIITEDTTLLDFIKTLSLKDVFYLVSKAWSAITESAVRATWDKALGDPFSHQDDTADPDDDEEDFLGFTQEEIDTAAERTFAAVQREHSFKNFVAAWAAQDEDEPTSSSLTTEELVEEAKGTEEEEEDDEEPAPAPAKITTEEAITMQTRLLQYYESQGDVVDTLNTKAALGRLKKRQSTFKYQTKITSLFKPV